MIFAKIDDRLTGNKYYDWYWSNIWCPIWRFFWGNPSEFLHRRKIMRQRARLGYSHEDYWCLNYHLAKYLAGVLEDWSKDINSYPYYNSFMQFTEQQWDEFIKDSAEAFKAWIEIEEGNDPFCQEFKTQIKKYKADRQIEYFFKVLAKDFDCFWD